MRRRGLPFPLTPFHHSASTHILRNQSCFLSSIHLIIAVNSQNVTPFDYKNGGWS
jgi:hypothetical protein